MMSKDLIMTLLNHKETSDSTGKLNEFNRFFFMANMAYIAIIVFNATLLLGYNYIQCLWHIIFDKSDLGLFLMSLSISIYISIVIHLVIEIKSFIYNLWTLFLVNILVRRAKRA